MSEADREKWQTRYRDGAYGGREYPSAYLVDVLSSIKPSTHKALDLACGAGRNALYLAQHGYHVDAVDISALALQRGKVRAQSKALDGIHWLECDLDESLPTGLTGYGLVIMMRYLDIDLLRSAAGRLVPGGYLLAEVHLQTDRIVAGPSGAAFRAAAGELATAAQGLRVIQHSETICEDPDGRTVALARVLAQKTDQ